MKEKTYFEVSAEAEGRSYDNLETQLEIGENCIRDIKALENSKDAKAIERLVKVNSKRLRFFFSSSRCSESYFTYSIATPSTQK